MPKYLLLLAGLAAGPALAQQAPKKPLDHTVYDQWQSVANQKISDNGKYVLFQVKPQQGDGTLYLKTVAGRQLRQLSRGDSAQFTADSRFVVFAIKPRYQDVRQARIKKKKPEQMPKDSIGIYNVDTGKLTKYANVKSFQVAEKAPVLAFLGVKPAVKDSLKKAPVDTVKKITDRLLETKKEGAQLTVISLTTGKLRTFEAVTDYQLSKPGNKVAFAVAAPKGSKTVKSGLFVYDLASNTLRQLSGGKGVYKNLAFDDAGQQLAFTAEKHPEKALVKPFSLYYSDFKADSARLVLAPGASELKRGWSPSGFGKVVFSENGEKLFFGTAPDPIPQDTTLVEFEHAKLDIWNYKDDYLQPMQLKNLKKDLQRNYLAVVYPKQGNKFLQLEDEYLRDSYVAERNNAEYILAVTDTAKRVAMQWEGSTRKQAYLVSTRTGARVAINPQAAKSQFQLSPQGKFVVWYDYATKNWYSFSVASHQTTNLTAKTGVAMADEENDSPDDAQPYGVAAWTKDDEAVLIFDRYDIWKINPQTGVATNFTGGVGRANKLIMRYRLPVEKQKFIEPKSELWLLAQNETTKQWGYYHKNVASPKAPQQAVLAPFGYTPLVQAKNAPVFIYTKSNVSHPADLYVSRDLTHETQLSTINPQQKDYNWFTAELTHWTTPKGYAATGVLYKPENFDPSKQYPMVVYFYEKLSEGLYKYTAPAPTPSRLDIALFASNGYLVFTPDISYTIGEPGPSAVEFINSGVEALKKNSWVDGAHIGLQGQSWGGYQVAYLITQTNMYAAAWAGAPVVNMTSAYGGIRWESGMSRQFQYERTRFDFAHNAPMTPGQITRVEAIVNAEILANHATEARTMSIDDAQKTGAMMLFGEKYGDSVRVLDIGSSRELCGGTHVTRTGDIGLFKIVSESGVAAGIRRVEAVTGDNALAYLQSLEHTVQSLATTLKAAPAEVPARLGAVLDQVRQLERELGAAKGRLASAQGDELLSRAVDIKGLKVLAARLDGADAKALRDTLDKLKSKLKTAAIVLAAVDGDRVQLAAGVTADSIGRVKAGDLVNFVAQQVGGKGGGKADLAMAGGTDASKLDSALGSVEGWVAERA